MYAILTIMRCYTIYIILIHLKEVVGYYRI